MIRVRESYSTQLKAPCLSLVRSADRFGSFPVTVLTRMFCCMGVRVRRRASIAQIVGMPPIWSLMRAFRIDPAVHSFIATIFSRTLLNHWRRDIDR